MLPVVEERSADTLKVIALRPPGLLAHPGTAGWGLRHFRLLPRCRSVQSILGSGLPNLVHSATNALGAFVSSTHTARSRRRWARHSADVKDSYRRTVRKKHSLWTKRSFLTKNGTVLELFFLGSSYLQ